MANATGYQLVNKNFFPPIIIIHITFASATHKGKSSQPPTTITLLRVLELLRHCWPEKKKLTI